jgi:hypothetical protein
MTKIFAVLILIVAVSCGQNKSSTKTFDTTTIQQLSFDTNKISVLPIDTSDYYLFKDANKMQLTNQDLKTVDKLLNECIQTHNLKQGTTKEFNEFIDLKKYKIQYIPFMSSNGQRKVYVNAFCNYYWNFDSIGWKKYIVQVDDGGSCFFHLTINLKENKYEEFYTNGYG